MLFDAVKRVPCPQHPWFKAQLGAGGNNWVGDGIYLLVGFYFGHVSGPIPKTCRDTCRFRPWGMFAGVLGQFLEASACQIRGDFVYADLSNPS